MSEVVLISQIPLPYSQIGSWTTLYKNYFELNNSQIDTIVCYEPKQRFKNINYCVVPNNFIVKLKLKITRKQHLSFIDALIDYVQVDKKYILQVVDNFGFIKALHEKCKQKPFLKKQFYIQFFYHGYDPFYGNFESRWFYEFIDEMVLLTYSSYVKHRETYTVLPCKFSILHNGVNTDKFKPVSVPEKLILKKKHKVLGKTTFLWCSQDRAKKGLDFLLSIWKKLIDENPDIQLWVIGATRDVNIQNVTFYGKVPNEKLPEYFQTSDCYLFPTLWQEGFGLSLIEALHCGNYSIASALGGVPEVLQNGVYGELIVNPHFEQEWINAISNYLLNKCDSRFDNSEYSLKQWSEQMNCIIQKAKMSHGQT